METLGIVAGSGRLPFVAAAEARAQGLRVVAVAVREETDPQLAEQAPRKAWEPMRTNWWTPVMPLMTACRPIST